MSKNVRPNFKPFIAVNESDNLEIKIVFALGQVEFYWPRRIDGKSDPIGEWLVSENIIAQDTLTSLDISHGKKSANGIRGLTMIADYDLGHRLREKFNPRTFVYRPQQNSSR